MFIQLDRKCLCVLSILDLVGIFSHVWVLHDIVGFEFTLCFGLQEGAVGVGRNLLISCLFESVVVDQVVEGFGGTLVDNILCILNTHSENSVNLFLTEVKWIKTRWNRTSWCNHISEISLLVSEFGSQKTVHGVVEG